MGNKLSVRNDTSSAVTCRVHPLGSEKAFQSKSIAIGSTTVFHFERQVSKIFIVSVDNKAVRAVSRAKIVVLKKVADAEYLIAVEDPGTSIVASSKDLIEGLEMDLNWNYLRNEEVKNDRKKSVTDSLRLMVDLNKHSAMIFGMITGLVVAQGTGSKEAASMATKVSSEFFNSYLKTSTSRPDPSEDLSTIIKINDIRQTLIAIRRDATLGYEYFKSTISRNEDHLVKYLFELLSKITTANIFPYLEDCGQEVAVSAYMFAISVVFDILEKIRKVRNNEVTDEERKYREVFVSNLKVIWDGVMENLDSNCTIKITGFCIKRAVLCYQKQMIYVVKGLSKGRAKSQIEDIQKQFIANRKYQLDFIYNHPSELVRRYEEQLNQDSS